MKLEHIAAAACVREISDLYLSSVKAIPYCHPLWVSILANMLDREARYLVVRQGLYIVAALPYLRRQAATIPIWIDESLPYDCYTYPLMRPSMEPSDADQARRLLYEGLASSGFIAKTYPAAWLDGAGQVGQLMPRAIRQTEDVYVKDLSNLAGEIDLIASYDKHHRYQLRTARKSDLEFTRATTRLELDEFYVILQETMARAGRLPKFSYEAVVTGGLMLIEAGLGTCYLSKVDGHSCAGAFVLHSDATSIYWLGVSTSDKRLLRLFPVFPLLHSAMLDTLNRGARTFELGAGPTQGLRDFKSKWGADIFTQTTYTMGASLTMAALRFRVMMQKFSRLGHQAVE